MGKSLVTKILRKELRRFMYIDSSHLISQKRVKMLMDGLVNQTRDDKMPEEVMDFLGSITANYHFPPQSWLFQYEINRLNFTHHAAYK
jgi:hypothetical protein